MRFFLQKTARIRKRSEFIDLSKRGRMVHSHVFMAAAVPSRAGHSRLGVTVTRKVGGAVERNRIKRLVREYFRLHGQRAGGHWDINVIAKKGAAGAANRELVTALAEIFTKVSKLDQH